MLEIMFAAIRLQSSADLGVCWNGIVLSIRIYCPPHTWMLCFILPVNNEGNRLKLKFLGKFGSLPFTGWLDLEEQLTPLHLKGVQ